MSAFKKAKHGYTVVPNDIIKAGCLSPKEMYVFLMIAMFDVCYLSVETMAEMSCLNPKTVRSALNSMRSKGLLTWASNPGRSNVYTITRDPSKWKLKRKKPLDPPDPKQSQT